MIRDEKYIVFKRSEWEAHLTQPGCMPPDMVIEDAVVIRKQDVFAPPALDAYSNAILCVIEALKATGHKPAEGLQKIADYFRAQAEDAYSMQRKLPD